MNAFIVELQNKPGELAKVTKAIADRAVNITGFSGSVCGNSGTAIYVTADDAATRQALDGARAKYRETEYVTVRLPDRPGTLAEATKLLADANVNIEAAFPTGMSAGNAHVAFVTDNPSKAKSALREWILEPTFSR
jgi:hypothetical protein